MAVPVLTGPSFVPHEHADTAPRGGVGAAVALTLGCWFAALMLLLVAAAHFQSADLDMFHQMALVRAALQQGSLPTVDLFAFTPTVTPSVHHEWGAGLILYLVTVTWGWGSAGLLLIRYLLLTGIVAVCYVCGRRAGARPAVLFICAPAATLMLALGLATVRAQMFTFFFLAVLLLLLQLDREGKRWWIAAWLPLFVIWLNIHGGFLVGAGLFGLYVVERIWADWRVNRRLGNAVMGARHLILTMAAMPALLLVNPYGRDYVPYLWNAVLLDRPGIMEWAPLWSDDVTVLLRVPYVAAVVLIAYAVARKWGTPIPGLALIVVAAIAPLSAQRLLPVFAIVWYCVGTPLLTGTPFPGLVESLSRRAAPLILVVTFAVGAAGAYRAAQHHPTRLRVPIVTPEGTPYLPGGAVDYLAQQGFSGNLMTDFNSGSYVSWKLHPAVMVGMDSRYEAAYSPDLVAEISDFYHGEPGWEDVLERYPPDAVLVPATSRLGSLLESAEHLPVRWVRTYRDDGYSLFVRESHASAFEVRDRVGESIEGSFP